MESNQCAVMACRKAILQGETYYMLGGGKVMTCEDCACNTPASYLVNGKVIQCKRGWDKTAVSKNLKKVM